MTRVAALILLATLVAGCASPGPTRTAPSTSPVPASPSPAPATELSTKDGEIHVACQTPIVPGHCLQPVAWAIRQLPAGHAPVAALTIRTVNLCPDASTCIGPPHRGEWWSDITLRDGSSLGLWVVVMLGMSSVQSLRAGATPPPSAEPAPGEFFITCGDVPDTACAGAAAGATDAIPNSPVAGVVVRAAARDRYEVAVTFVDGTEATATVAPDPTRDVGWSAVRSAEP
jgi:hypothetical protein